MSGSDCAAHAKPPKPHASMLAPMPHTRFDYPCTPELAL
jgi:hypothetical protein